MVVLSRARGEAIQIGDDIVVTIVDIRGDKVRLGIEVPPDMPLHRPDVNDSIRRNVQPSATSPAPVAIQPPHFATASPDPLGRFAAILETRLGVPITRDLIARALAEAGLEVTAGQPARS